ncbi:MAG TPA: FkbM family methyltransferase [Xanthobacteraceae bacterium]|nr:FkbM family methyltransferase [Xanthobacteraceae bacterium]
MPITSYAQNFEDVMLARAFPGAQGFYVDVGANDPDIDNVTRVFYERGWSGINIEPLAANMQTLRAKRPRDINLEIAVGENDGAITFYEVAKWHGYSTTDASIIEQHRKDGLEITERKVPVRKLSDVLDEHAKDKAIDFLKIDVEGTELSVLRGIDLRRHRPKIILLESKMPVTINMVDRVDEVPDRADEYSNYLAPFGYRFAYHDGLNAFYVADEHRALEKAFSRPPGTFDKISHEASVRPYREEMEVLRERMRRDQRRFAIVTGTLALLALVAIYFLRT